MAYHGDPPVSGSLDYVAPGTTSYPFQPQQQPCPTCHRCPTCGSYRPVPYTWPNTWTTGTVGTGTGTLDLDSSKSQFSYVNPSANMTATAVPSSFISALAEEKLKQQMQLAQATAVNCAADCSHDD